MKNLLAALFLISCVVGVQAQTNDLWFVKVVAPTGQLTPRQICEFIESESARLSPEGKGLTVMYHPGLDKWNMEGGTTFSSNPISFYELLDAAASVFAFPRDSARVFENVGVIPWAQHRYAYIAIEGRCLDADSGDPITNFSVKGGSLCAPILAIQTNGYFVGGIQQRFDFSTCAAATFTEFDIMEGIKQILTFSAPGYNPLVVTNEIFPPGEPTVGLRTYDIKLTRTDQYQGDQASPACPPHGVGSPGP
ncbi:MAG: hypothetical protein PHI39_05945 [Kiritimatiellae bacterium]|jgi:hypothetical protein|nr:hypothetical protein [Kiritimatiellia bacterium]